MFDGLKFRRGESNNDDEHGKKNKRSAAIIIGFVAISVLYTLINYITGSEAEKAEFLSYIRNNFHISPVDLTIFAVCVVIFIIIKIKERKK